MIDENTWLISDTHLDHDKLTEIYEPIRIETALKHGYKYFDDFQIDQWNSKIKDEDTILHMGDFTINKFDDDKTYNNIRKFSGLLNGRKILMRGNHDRAPAEIYEDLGWIVIKEPLINDHFPYIIYELNGQKMLICHLPIRDLSSVQNDRYQKCYEQLAQVFEINECSVSVHGHSHSYQQPDSRCINLSVENTDFLPVKLGNILNL